MKQGMQQGNADGLCGLYALLNFLSSTSDWKPEKPSDALRYLLQSASDRGWLTPSTITDGFLPFQLKIIIDDQFNNYRMPFESFHLSDAVRGSPEMDFYSFAKAIISQGGSILGGPDLKHWLLLTDHGGKLVTIDSSNSLKPIKNFDRRCHEFHPYGGVVIMPTAQPSVKLV